MKIQFIVTVSILILVLTTRLSAEEYRVFTDTQNRTIQAKPINVVGNQIRIQRDDGSEFNVSITLFSEADQTYLKDWMIRFLSEHDRMLDIEAKRHTGKVTKTKEDVTLTTGKIVKNARYIKEFDAGYKIVIKNKSKNTFEHLNAKYILFSEQDAIAAKSGKDKSYQRKKGKQAIPIILAQDNYTFETKTIRLTNTELKKGIRYCGGGDTESDAKLSGIWIRVFKDEQLITDYSYPSNIATEEDW